MSVINMLSWWQWLIMAAVPPLIIMLYFLKLRRIPVVVPSTYLWRRTVEDLHVNSIWQKLRNNLLLLLQLLAVLALILACLRPGFRGEETLGARSIIMVDTSASMQATDVKPSRLSQAKQQAIDLIDAMGRGDVAMVIAFSDRAEVKQGFTSDKKKLKAAVESIVATNRITDLNEALRAAAGLANPGRTSQIEDMNDIQVAEAMPATVYLLSDGRFPAPQIDLGNLTAEYLAIGTDAPTNVGIVAFTVERNIERPGSIEAFARVHNFGRQAAELTASLSMNGNLVDAASMRIEADGVESLSFEVAEAVEGELMLELETSDDFSLDDRAYAGLDPPRQLEVVLVTDGNTPLEAGLSTEQVQSLATVRIMGTADLELPEGMQLAQSGSIDLFIYDHCVPPTMPAANTLFLGGLPPDARWAASEPTGPLFIIDSNKSHPMLQYVDMGTVRIVEGRSLELPQGATELLRTDAGILMAVAPRDAYQDAVVAMPLVQHSEGAAVPNTDWPIKRSFPVFLFNSLEYLGGAMSTAGSKSVRPGQPTTLNLASRYERVEVEAPVNRKVTLERAGQPQMVFTQTDELGVYQARGLGTERVLQMFTVNLFSEQESQISLSPDVQIGAETVAAEADRKDIARVEYWRWLLALALVVLSVEWFLYNRRVAL